MKTLKENCFLLCILFYAIVLLKSKIPSIIFICCILIWKFRTKDKSFLLLIVLFLIPYIPKYSNEYPTMKQGRVVLATNTYAVLQNKNEKVIVYVDEMLPFDSVYSIDGKFSPLSTSSGFYRFNQEKWYSQLGVSYSVQEQNIHLDKKGYSIRSYLQNKIEQIDDLETRKQLFKVLFNIKTDDNDSYLFEHGFSYVAILYIFNIILKFFVTSKRRNYCLLIINVCLLLIYHAPFILVQSFLFRVLKLTKLDTNEQFTLGMVLIFLLYSEYCTTLSFIIPFLYRISSIFRDKKTVTLFMLWIQSYSLHEVNLFQTLLYPYLILLTGIAWILGSLRIWISWIPFMAYCHLFEAIGRVISMTTIYSSFIGFGFAFYIILCYSFINSKYRTHIAIALFLIFSYTGLFHPFAEVTFINVGQGDSILIREPLNTNNVLIDTGKPSQWGTLQTFLQSKGIRKINTLFITHEDSDHSGNLQNVIDSFQVEEVITQHQKYTQSMDFIFYDLNTIENEDENQSSFALYSKINGLTYMLMGDCDETSEEQIIKKYPQLHCEILKLGHHGSNTSSSDQFLDTIQPTYGIISSGAYSIYHHPSIETIQKLLKRHITYFDTKEEGDISIICFPYFNLFVTSNGKIGIIQIL